MIGEAAGQASAVSSNEDYPTKLPLQYSSDTQPGDNVESMDEPSVIGREAGEREPLLLRTKFKTNIELDHLRQLVVQL